MVTTKKGNVREPVDPSKLVQGLNSPIDFRPNGYGEEPFNHLPDFRSTIFWNPSFKTSRDGKAVVEFYASDNLGELHVRIDGFTSRGVPFSKDVVLHVVNN